MLYKLLIYFAKNYPAVSFLNVFSYISFRCVVVFLINILFWLIFGAKIIDRLRKWQGSGQPISDYVPESHMKKHGTPTMGGIIIIALSVLSSLCFCNLRQYYCWIVIFSMVGFAIIGFFDDYLKVIKRSNKGMTAFCKMSLQLFMAALIFLWLFWLKGGNVADGNLCSLTIPFLKNTTLYLSYFYIPFMMFVIVGSSNAVNLTDGIDSLASGIMVINLCCFGVIIYACGHANFARYLTLPYMVGFGEVSIICAAVAGAILGFLWFNAHPASIFMGDVGSLPLGAVLGTLAILAKHELLLPLTGIIFVVETLSVILQVFWLRMLKKKLFFIAPLHHHFEKKGWSEPEIIIRFWLITILFAAIAMSSLKIR